MQALRTAAYQAVSVLLTEIGTDKTSQSGGCGVEASIQRIESHAMRGTGQTSFSTCWFGEADLPLTGMLASRLGGLTTLAIGALTSPSPD